jgi:hypothetical protein
MKILSMINAIFRTIKINLSSSLRKSTKFHWQYFITLIIGFCLVISLGIIEKPAVAQINQAIIQEILDGDQVFIETAIAKVEDKAQFGQIVLTKESRAGMLFNNGAAGRLGINSSVAVGQCVEVQEGAILVSGPINGCMAGITVAVQGTVYVLETTDGKSGNVKVVEGSVKVSPTDGSGETVTLKEGEKIDVLEGILGQIIPMTPEEIVSLLNGQLFSGFQIPITAEGALQSACSRLLPGLSCSTTGLPSYPLPIPSIPFSIPGLPF